MTTIQHQSRRAKRMPPIEYHDGVQLRLITKSDKSREKFAHIHTHTHRIYLRERKRTRFGIKVNFMTSVVQL